MLNVRILGLICLGFIIAGCNQTKKTNDDKIFLTYLYYQKLADKEAGCTDHADTNCLEKFNKIWPLYSDSIVKAFNIDDKYLDKVIMNALEKQAASRDWTLNRMSEDKLKVELEK
jgi:hypothetical protein